ncbi:hypothetical protein E2C01_026367 [Portunus trituberculatus]|uniref:Uncharacterized protein n=1 Tax=Portunus trituberculatus TaxID=210409 RepID=A0A5B7EI37_PORTR|nr:hypothetical protein [Portunus trituberculatus]
MYLQGTSILPPFLEINGGTVANVDAADAIIAEVMGRAVQFILLNGNFCFRMMFSISFFGAEDLMFPYNEEFEHHSHPLWRYTLKA